MAILLAATLFSLLVYANGFFINSSPLARSFALRAAPGQKVFGKQPNNPPQQPQQNNYQNTPNSGQNAGAPASNTGYQQYQQPQSPNNGYPNSQQGASPNPGTFQTATPNNNYQQQQQQQQQQPQSQGYGNNNAYQVSSPNANAPGSFSAGSSYPTTDRRDTFETLIQGFIGSDVKEIYLKSGDYIVSFSLGVQNHIENNDKPSTLWIQAEMKGEAAKKVFVEGQLQKGQVIAGLGHIIANNYVDKVTQQEKKFYKVAMTKLLTPDDFTRAKALFKTYQDSQ